MSKGLNFWLELWQQGTIPFHKQEVHPDLITFWPKLQLKPKSTVLVPLCGKSLDMCWFLQQGCQVIGIELSEQAVIEFFQEQQLSFTVETYAHSKKYLTDSLCIWVGDIFNLDNALIPAVDAIYDRAALIALPKQLRPIYTALCFNWLKPGGCIFLKTLCYEDGAMQGPPYSVSPEETMQLYAANATVTGLQIDQKEHSTHEGNSITVEGFLWSIIKYETKS